MFHRMEMWEKAESKLLKTIELDSATIHWTKKDRELMVNGEYFDVVSVTYHHGRATIKGVFDYEETEMHEAFARKQQNENEPGSGTQKIADWLLQLWTNNDNPIINYLNVRIRIAFAMSKPEGIVSNGLQPPVPPPWYC